MSRVHHRRAAGTGKRDVRTSLGQAKYEFRQTIKPTVAPLTAAITLSLGAGDLQAARITVDTLADTLDGSACSLRAATYAATTNSTFAGCTAGESGYDVIEFATSLTGTIQLDPATSTLYSDASLRLGSDMAIIGPGADLLTVRGDNASSVVYAKYDSQSYPVSGVSISNLTITNGRADYGGGIYSKVPSLSLLNMRVVDNTADEAGGGIWHRPPLVDSDFDLFFSEVSGNESLSTNTPVGGGGLGLHLEGNRGTVRIDNSTLAGNTAYGKGGGLYLYWDDDATLYLTYSEFDGNQSKYAGGGAYLNMGVADATIAANVFSSNDATATVVGASGDGGGMVLTQPYGHQGSLDGVGLFRNDFLTNTAEGRGGGLQIHQTDGIDFRIAELTATGNTAGGDGGGLHLQARSATVALEQTVLSDNQSDAAGGGASLRLASSYLDVLDTTSRDNSAQSKGGGASILADSTGVLDFRSSVFSGNFADAGGGLHVEGDSDFLNVTESAFRANDALDGGGLALSLGFNSDVLIQRSEVSGNTAVFDGGGVRASLGSGYLHLVNSTVSGNVADENGGGIDLSQPPSARGYYTPDLLKIEHSTLAYNMANVGGGVYVAGMRSFVERTVLSGNTGLSSGAALAGNDEFYLSDSLIDDSATGATIIDYFGNLFDTPAELLPLGDNGGPTLTHAPSYSSPVLDALGTVTTPQTDQRGTGFDRVYGSGLDIGAFERQTTIDILFQDRFEQR